MKLDDILRGAAVLALAVALAACGSTSESGRTDRVETAIEEGCPVSIPGTSVNVQLLSRQAIYEFRADDDESVEAVRESVRELANSYNEYASEHPASRPPQYARGTGDDVGDEQMPLLPHVRASTLSTEQGAKLILEVPDPDLAHELRSYVERDMSNLRTGVCTLPGESVR